MSDNYDFLPVRIGAVISKLRHLESSQEYILAYHEHEQLEAYIRGFVKGAKDRLLKSHIAKGEFEGSPKCVHTEHCCIVHGCKYRDKDCPVETGKAVQSYPCESCGGD